MGLISCLKLNGRISCWTTSSCAFQHYQPIQEFLCFDWPELTYFSFCEVIFLYRTYTLNRQDDLLICLQIMAHKTAQCKLLVHSVHTSYLCYSQVQALVSGLVPIFLLVLPVPMLSWTVVRMVKGFVSCNFTAIIL